MNLSQQWRLRTEKYFLPLSRCAVWLLRCLSFFVIQGCQVTKNWIPPEYMYTPRMYVQYMYEYLLQLGWCEKRSVVFHTAKLQSHFASLLRSSSMTTFKVFKLINIKYFFQDGFGPVREWASRPQTLRHRAGPGAPGPTPGSSGSSWVRLLAPHKKNWQCITM